MSCPDGKKLNRLRGRILSLEYFGDVWPSPGTSTARTYLLRGTIPAIDWKEVRNDVETCKVLLKDMADATLKKTKEPLKSSSEFRHSPDYATVVRHGKQFTLTPQQAQIIQILHEAFKNGTPSLKPDYILEKIEGGTRLLDSFKSNKAAYESLIAKGERTVRLNL